MIPEEAIRIRSYLIWQKEGCPDGKALEHWLRAIAELEIEARPPLQLFSDCQRQVVARPPITQRPQKTYCRRVHG